MVLFGGIMRRRVEEAESRGWAQGFAEGWAQEFAKSWSQGFAKGVAQEREKWREWNRRRLEADAAGRPFTEPLPTGPLPDSVADGGQGGTKTGPRPSRGGGGNLNCEVCDEQ